MLVFKSLWKISCFIGGACLYKQRSEKIYSCSYGEGPIDLTVSNIDELAFAIITLAEGH